jgi:hypothetical protein
MPDPNGDGTGDPISNVGSIGLTDISNIERGLESHDTAGGSARGPHLDYMPDPNSDDTGDPVSNVASIALTDGGSVSDRATSNVRSESATSLSSVVTTNAVSALHDTAFDTLTERHDTGRISYVSRHTFVDHGATQFGSSLHTDSVLAHHDTLSFSDSQFSAHLA